MELEKRLQSFPYKLILGSASPRRQELLKSLGFSYTLSPVNADEQWPQELKGEQISLFLSKLKSDGFNRPLEKNELLITADTIVWCENKVYNKPLDFEDGKKMLASLAGRMHEVFTSVCLRSADKRVSFTDCSKVFFKPLSEAEIEYYLRNFKPYDKAGAYGVQDWLGYVAIEKIEGSFYNVMGLPVKLLYEHLMDF